MLQEPRVLGQPALLVLLAQEAELLALLVLQASQVPQVSKVYKERRAHKA